MNSSTKSEQTPPKKDRFGGIIIDENLPEIDPVQKDRFGGIIIDKNFSEKNFKYKQKSDEDDENQKTIQLDQFGGVIQDGESENFPKKLKEKYGIDISWDDILKGKGGIGENIDKEDAKKIAQVRSDAKSAKLGLSHIEIPSLEKEVPVDSQGQPFDQKDYEKWKIAREEAKAENPLSVQNIAYDPLNAGINLLWNVGEGVPRIGSTLVKGGAKTLASPFEGAYYLNKARLLRYKILKEPDEEKKKQLQSELVDTEKKKERLLTSTASGVYDALMFFPDLVAKSSHQLVDSTLNPFFYRKEGQSYRQAVADAREKKLKEAYLREKEDQEYIEKYGHPKSASTLVGRHYVSGAKMLENVGILPKGKASEVADTVSFMEHESVDPDVQMALGMIPAASFGTVARAIKGTMLSKTAGKTVAEETAKAAKAAKAAGAANTKKHFITVAEKLGEQVDKFYDFLEKEYPYLSLGLSNVPYVGKVFDAAKYLNKTIRPVWDIVEGATKAVFRGSRSGEGALQTAARDVASPFAQKMLINTAKIGGNIPIEAVRLLPSIARAEAEASALMALSYYGETGDPYGSQLAAEHALGMGTMFRLGLYPLEGKRRANEEMVRTVRHWLSTKPEAQQKRILASASFPIHDPKTGKMVPRPVLEILARMADQENIIKGFKRDAGEDASVIAGSSEHLLEQYKKSHPNATEADIANFENTIKGGRGFFVPDYVQNKPVMYINTNYLHVDQTAFHEWLHGMMYLSPEGSPAKDVYNTTKDSLVSSLKEVYSPEERAGRLRAYLKNLHEIKKPEWRSHFNDAEIKNIIGEVNALIEQHGGNSPETIGGVVDIVSKAVKDPKNYKLRRLFRDADSISRFANDLLENRLSERARDKAFRDNFNEDGKTLNSKGEELIASELLAEHARRFMNRAKGFLIPTSRKIAKKDGSISEFFSDDGISHSADSGILYNIGQILMRFGVKFNANGDPIPGSVPIRVHDRYNVTGGRLKRSEIIDRLIADLIQRKSNIRERFALEEKADRKNTVIVDLPKVFGVDAKRVIPLAMNIGAIQTTTDADGNTVPVLDKQNKPIWIKPNAWIKNKDASERAIHAAIERAGPPNEVGSLPYDPARLHENAKLSGGFLAENQINSILADPLINASTKKRIVAWNNILRARWNGDPNAQITDVILDYYKVYSKGKAGAYAKETRYISPIGIQITKQGNVNILVFDVGHFLAQLDSKVARNPRILDFWMGSRENLINDIYRYMDNHRNGRKGAAGLGISSDVNSIDKIGMEKASIINAILNFGTKENQAVNDFYSFVNRKTTVDGDLEPGSIRTFRLERIADPKNTSERPFFIDYRKGVTNFMPERADSRSIDDLGFYSKVDEAIKDLPDQFTFRQLKSHLSSKKGIKSEELEWRNFAKHFEDKKPEDKVTKEEVQDWADSNRVEVQEVMKEEDHPPIEFEETTEYGDPVWVSSKVDPIRSGGDEAVLVIRELKDKHAYENEDELGNYYAVEISSDYRYGEQYVDNFDTIDDAKRYIETHYSSIGSIDSAKFKKYTEKGGSDYRELLLTLPERTREESNFRSTHYSEPNILAHVRFNTRRGKNGEKILFLEEVQSDWHQEGREKGYNLSSEKTTPMDAEYRALVNKNADAVSSGRLPLPEDVARAKELEDALIRSDKSKISDAPFKKSWPQLIMKRMLAYAAENGFDAIAWTRGEQQVDRYRLSKTASKITYDGSDLKAFNHNGDEIISRSEISPEDLPSLIGENASERLMSQKPEGNLRTISGVDLDIGGKSMKVFYDEMLPNFSNKIFKRFGIRSEKISIDGMDGEFNALKIPEEVAETIREEGQPRFMPSRDFRDQTPEEMIATGKEIADKLSYSMLNLDYPKTYSRDTSDSDRGILFAPQAIKAMSDQKAKALGIEKDFASRNLVQRYSDWFSGVPNAKQFVERRDTILKRIKADLANKESEYFNDGIDEGLLDAEGHNNNNAIGDPEVDRMIEAYNKASPEQKKVYKAQILEGIQNNQHKIFDGWINYLDRLGVSESEKILILDGIARERALSKDGDIKVVKLGGNAMRLPHSVNPEIASRILTALSSGHQNDRVSVLWSNFAKEIEARKMKSREKVDSVASDGTKGQWILYPSEESDPKNFASNVSGLESLAQTSTCLGNKPWCTATGSALDQLSRGDFWVLTVDGNARVGVRMTGSKDIGEIRGVDKGQGVEPQFVDSILTLVKKKKFHDGESYVKNLRVKGKLNAIEARLEKGEDVSADEIKSLIEDLKKTNKDYEKPTNEEVLYQDGKFRNEDPWLKAWKRIQDKMSGDLNWEDIETVKILDGSLTQEHLDLIPDNIEAIISENVSIPHIASSKVKLVFEKNSSAHSLEKVGDLRLDEGAFVPKLREVGGEANLYENSSAPLLEKVGESLNLYGGASAPKLREVGGYADVRENASAPLLERVGGELHLYEGASALKLREVGGYAKLYKNSSAPSLEKVGGEIKAHRTAHIPLLRDRYQIQESQYMPAREGDRPWETWSGMEVSEGDSPEIRNFALSASGGESGVRKNLRTHFARREGTGIAKNNSTFFWFKDNDGKEIPMFIGSDIKSKNNYGKNFDNWIKEVELILTPNEIREAAHWYKDVAKLFAEKLPEGVDGLSLNKMIVAWLASQQNVSPSGGLRYVFHELDNLLGAAHGKKGGLAFKKLRQIISDEIPDSGYAAKLVDFLDSATGHLTRSYMGGMKEAGQPFVADIHTGRDSGHIDSTVISEIVDRANDGQLFVSENSDPNSPKIALQVKSVVRSNNKKKEPVSAIFVGKKRNGKTIKVEINRDLIASPSSSQYEGISVWGNKLTQYLNEKKFMGRDDWTAPEVQAVGWMRMTRQIGEGGQSVKDIFERNTHNIRTPDTISREIPEWVSPEKRDFIAKSLFDHFSREIAKPIGAMHIMHSDYSPIYVGEKKETSYQISILGSSYSTEYFARALGAILEEPIIRKTVFGVGGKTSRSFRIFERKENGQESKLSDDLLLKLSKAIVDRLNRQDIIIESTADGKSHIINGLTSEGVRSKIQSVIDEIVAQDGVTITISNVPSTTEKILSRKVREERGIQLKKEKHNESEKNSDYGIFVGGRNDQIIRKLDDLRATFQSKLKRELRRLLDQEVGGSNRESEGGRKREEIGGTRRRGDVEEKTPRGGGGGGGVFGRGRGGRTLSNLDLSPERLALAKKPARSLRRGALSDLKILA